MKIAIISTEVFPIPPIKGGAVETWIFETAKYNSKGGCRIYSLGIGDSTLLKRERDSNNIEYLRFTPKLFSRLMLCSYRLPFKQFNSKLYYLPFSLWCISQLKKIKPNIIHIHSRPQFVYFVSCLTSNAKIILHIHNLEILDLIKIWNHFSLKKINLILGCSKFVAEKIKQRYPLLEKNVCYIHNGVNTDRFKPIWLRSKERLEIRRAFGIDNETKVILFIGRLVYVKGVHILIEAFKEILKLYDDTKLVIIGSQGYNGNMSTEYIKRLRFSIADSAEKVIFTGHVPHNELDKMLLLGDIAVFPSIWEEPFGMTIIEAMACGLPIVAFSKGGIPEIINDRENGILIDNYGDISLLIQSIIDLLGNKNERFRLGLNARLKVEQNFSWEKISQDLIKIYGSIL